MTISLIGVGHMGGAILKALINRNLAAPQDVLIADAAPGRAEQLQAELGVRVAAPAEMTAASDVIILAVRPGDLAGVLSTLPRDAVQKPLFLSIAAGRRLAWLEGLLPGARFIRVMPNLGVSVGLGMCGYARGALATDADVALTQTILTSFGKALPLPEEKLDAVTALSGSGPAFIAFALRSMIEGGMELGFTAEEASTLALQTFAGTAAVLTRPGAPDASAFIASVATKGGTTAAGMAVLDGSDIAAVYAKTLQAAATRSAELSAL